MTLQEAAQIYIDLVELEKSLDPDQRQARQEVSALRSKYHDLFTQALRETGIECADRFEATQRAFELVASDASDRGDCYTYTTVNGRQYKIIRFCGWQLSTEDPYKFYCAYYVRPPVSSKGSEERLIQFSFGCETFFGGEFYDNKADQIPEELATLTIQWLLEEAGEPPVGCLYRGVFTRKGLRHRVGQPEDQQFGEDVCLTLRNVVERVRHNLSEAKERGRQIGFRPPSSEFWTQKPKIAQHV